MDASSNSTSKACSRCGIYKPLEDFVGLKAKTYHCKACHRIRSKEYRANNPEKMQAYRDEHKSRYREYWKKRYQENKEELGLEMKERYESLKNDPAFKQSRAEYFRNWRLTERGSRLHRDKENRRRAQKLSATPSWANKNVITEIYLNCPDGYHVDHIVPLQGKNVCGLHVEWNLQYLPANENLKKGNRLSGGGL